MQISSITKIKAWASGVVATAWAATRIPKITSQGAGWLEARGFRVLGFICRQSPGLVMLGLAAWAIAYRLTVSESTLERVSVALSGVYLVLVSVLGLVPKRGQP